MLKWFGIFLLLFLTFEHIFKINLDLEPLAYNKADNQLLLDYYVQNTTKSNKKLN